MAEQGLRQMTNKTKFINSYKCIDYQQPEGTQHKQEEEDELLLWEKHKKINREP